MAESEKAEKIESILPREIDDEMKQSYLDYAMSVIVGRALPDVSDGLKPVHRRVLYTMWESGLLHNKPFRKSANVVGNCMAKFHPHGDAAIYDALVRLAQDFSLRYPLVEGQGNFGCFTADTKVKLADGRDLSFTELIKEHKEGKKNFTFTIDENGIIKIAEIKNPRLTKKDQHLIKVVLDNGEEIKCTLGHKFMLRNGAYREAQQLKPGDSLMPLNLRFSTKEDAIKPELVGYQMLHQLNTGQWVGIHILADEWNLEHGVYARNSGKIRHHLDFNKLNNNPENIARMQWKDHWKLHAEHASHLQKDPDYMKKLAKKAGISLRERWQDTNYKEKIIKSKILGYVNSLNKKYTEITPEIYEKERYNNCIPRFNTALKYFDNISDMIKQAEVYNHKVLYTEILTKKEDVYDLTIDETHNFALSAGIFVHNSIDGDPPAAMRYSECRLTKLAEEMLQDIDKETVKFIPNFDGSLDEPTVLPSKLPNLLVNGSSGIAVGMATNIPPHNISEVCDGIIQVIDNPGISVQQLTNFVKGPDFPTGAIISGRNGIISAYSGGRGKITIKSKVRVERIKNKECIIVEEIPYMVNKSQLIEQIAELVNHKKIVGISDIRDESDREGMRIVFELKPSANSDIVLNQLYRHTRLEDSFGIIMLALVDNQPKILSLKSLILEFIKHRQIVIRKRTAFDLDKAEKKAHVLEGLLIALKNIDEIIRLVKKSKTIDDARNTLISRFMLSIEQATAILEMRLQRLTSLEQEKILQEHKDLLKLIVELKSILASEQRILEIIKNEMRGLKEKYGDSRKTMISDEEAELEMEDLVASEENIITISNDGYIKRLQADVYKQQKRGGKGIIAATTKEEDTIKHLFTANTHNYILFFTNKGKVYWLKVYQIPEAGRQAKGTAIVNLLKLEKEEKITTLMPIEDFSKGFLVFATKKGIVKKCATELFSNPRKTGIIAISLDKDDMLINVELTDGKQQMIIATANGQAIKFHEKDVRATGRIAMGVIGIKLKKDDYIIGMEPADDKKSLLTITENGYGKRSAISEYRLINRGGSGVINIICSERNGKVVEIKTVEDNDEILIITQKGIAIRIPMKDISVIGRNTQGVRLMKLEQGDKVVAATKIVRDNNK